MTERTLIYFPPGCYGHFIHWCINYFSTDADMPLPFDDSGSSHLLSIKQKIDHGLVLLDKIYDNIFKHDHPIWLAQPTRINQDVDQELKTICNDFDHIIIIHGQQHVPQWIANNNLTKTQTYSKDPNHAFNLAYRKRNIKYFGRDVYMEYCMSQNWDRMKLYYKCFKDQPTENLEIWQIRENLSHWHSKDFYGHLGESAVLIDSDQTCLIDLYDICNHFEQTIKKILKKLKLPVLKQDFERVYNEWNKRQVHRHKDIMIRDIVINLTSNKDFVFDRITCLDEIIIQKTLREKGYELKCDGLNTFPTTMNELRKIIYKT